MTIGGWIIFAILALMVLGFGICGAYLIENVAGKIISSQNYILEVSYGRFKYGHQMGNPAL